MDITGKSNQQQLIERKITDILRRHGVDTYESLVEDLYILVSSYSIEIDANEWTLTLGCGE